MAFSLSPAEFFPRLLKDFREGFTGEDHKNRPGAARPPGVDFFKDVSRMNDYMLSALFWGLGGLINGVAGFGAALIAMPMVTQFVDITVAVPACTLISLGMNSQTGLTYRKHADWHRLKFLIIGAFPGTLLGVTLMKQLPGTWLKLAMGCFLIMYSTWSLFFEGRVKVRASRHWGLLAGCCSTAIGTAFGMGGPPTIVYTSLTGWSRDQIKAAIGAFFMVAGVIMITAQLLSGLQSMASLGLALVSIPASIMGGWIGIRLSRHIGEFSYRRILFSLLAFMGMLIIYRAL